MRAFYFFDLESTFSDNLVLTHRSKYKFYPLLKIQRPKERKNELCKSRGHSMSLGT